VHGNLDQNPSRRTDCRQFGLTSREEKRIGRLQALLGRPVLRSMHPHLVGTIGVGQLALHDRGRGIADSNGRKPCKDAYRSELGPVPAFRA